MLSEDYFGFDSQQKISRPLRKSARTELSAEKISIYSGTGAKKRTTVVKEHSEDTGNNDNKLWAKKSKIRTIKTDKKHKVREISPEKDLNKKVCLQQCSKDECQKTFKLQKKKSHHSIGTKQQFLFQNEPLASQKNFSQKKKLIMFSKLGKARANDQQSGSTSSKNNSNQFSPKKDYILKNPWFGKFKNTYRQKNQDYESTSLGKLRGSRELSGKGLKNNIRRQTQRMSAGSYGNSFRKECNIQQKSHISIQSKNGDKQEKQEKQETKHSEKHKNAEDEPISDYQRIKMLEKRARESIVNLLSNEESPQKIIFTHHAKRIQPQQRRQKQEQKKKKSEKITSFQADSYNEGELLINSQIEVKENSEKCHDHDNKQKSQEIKRKFIKKRNTLMINRENSRGEQKRYSEEKKRARKVKYEYNSIQNDSESKTQPSRDPFKAETSQLMRIEEQMMLHNNQSNKRNQQSPKIAFNIVQSFKFWSSFEERKIKNRLQAIQNSSKAIPLVVTTIVSHLQSINRMASFIEESQLYYEEGQRNKEVCLISFFLFKKFFEERSKILEFLRNPKQFSKRGKGLPSREIQLYFNTPGIDSLINDIEGCNVLIWRALSIYFWEVKKLYANNSLIFLEKWEKSQMKYLALKLKEQFYFLIRKLKEEENDEPDAEKISYRCLRIMEVIFLLSELEKRPVGNFPHSLSHSQRVKFMDQSQAIFLMKVQTLLK